MTFIGSSKVAASLGKVANDDAVEKASVKANDHFTPSIVSSVDAKHAGLANTSLHDLFHAPDNSTSTFRTCFYVTKVEPSNLNDAVKSWDKAKKKVGPAKADGNILQMQFLCKDVSTQSNNNVYRVLLYTHEGLGSNFIQGKVGKNLDKLKACVDTLTKFNSWVDAVVERRNGYYFIKDTKFVF